MNKVILSIEGMSCSACSNAVEKYLNKQQGVLSASVNLVLAQVLIEYDDTLTIDDLNRFVKESGYKSLGVYDEKREEKKKNNKSMLILFSILSIIVLYISMAHMIGIPVIKVLDMENKPLNYSLSLLVLTIPFLIYAYDILKSGFKNLIHKSPNMDTLVSIGVISSFSYSVFGVVMIIMGKNHFVHNLYFESAAIVIYFIKLGRFVESKSKERTKDAIKDLVQITPTKAVIKIENGEKEVTIDEVNKGDILICKPGMKIAVDGTIIKGEAYIDEAFIIGESIPSKKINDSKVVAGSINLDGYIEYEAERIGRNSTISEIVRLVLEATNTKAPIAKIADKVSGVFVPGIMIIAILTFIIYIILGVGINLAFAHFVTVLVVACPCALGLATPLAIVVSEGLAAKNGILIKTSETLENAHKIDTVVFDKTGTLTQGKLNISKIYNYSELSDNDLIKNVASIENKLTHPIANAFLNYVKENKLELNEIKEFENIAGYGLKAKINETEYYIGNNKILNKLNIENKHIEQENELASSGNSIVYVIKNKDIIALIGVKDIVRLNVKDVILKLKNKNKNVIMLTGDNELTAKVVAEELGIDNVIANVLPKEKSEKIKELLKNNNKVIMVGDGINDAPSLATATIGVSVSSGTDIANNSADVILINDNLMNLVNLMYISKKTIRNIKENLFWAFFYNICMLPLAIGLFAKIGLRMNPMIAGFAMTISSLTVIFNALRLKLIKLK